MQAVPRRGRGSAQADGLLHHHVHPRHGGAHTAHLGVRRQGPARRDGAAADQPSAGLPGLRQGRRVPAAEPGHVQRPGRDPLRGRQTHLPQTDPDLVGGAAGPGTVRAVRAVHPVLPADRGRPVHRAVGARCAAAGRHRAGRAVLVVLLRQHRADLPGGCPHQHGLPVPGPAVRPGVQPQRVRALRVGLRSAHRPSARKGVAPVGRRRPGGQRGVELRQGPLGVHLREESATASPHRRSARRTASCGPRRGRKRSALRRRGCGRVRARRRAGRRPEHRRRRLRIFEVRPDGVGHQRHRLPDPRAQRRGSGVPGRRMSPASR